MLRVLHRWVGLALMLPLLLEAGTGTILVLAPLASSARPAAGPMLQAGGMERLAAAAQHAAPPNLVALRIDPARWPGDSVAVFMAPAGERHASLRITVDPATATVNGISRSPAVLRFLHDLHARLLLPGTGSYATSVTGTLLFGLAVTGLLIWWPHPSLWRDGRWRRTIVPARRARGLRLWRELHISIGFWCCLMLAFMSASGVMMAFPGARTLFGLPPGTEGRNTEPVHGQPSDGIAGLDRALLLLARDHPDATLQSIRLGRTLRADRFVVLLPGRGPNHPVQMRTARTGGAIEPVADPGGTGPRLYRWLHLLHETQLAAPEPVAVVWAAAVFLCGASLIVLSLSGTVMWAWKRRLRSLKERTAKATARPVA